MIEPKHCLLIAALGLGAVVAAPTLAWSDEPIEVTLVDHVEEEEEDEDDPFAEFLFEPELVLEHSAELGLTDAQRDALIDRVVDIQAEVTRMELKAARDHGELMRLLQEEPMDADAILPLVDNLLTVESETKRKYVRLLIEIRNELTPEQRAQLDAIRHDD
ncbi:MAG: periplasmic heavy metal sensor [Pseudomonadota bacterium]